MVKAVCGSSRMHGLEGGKIPQGIYLSLLRHPRSGDFSRLKSDWNRHYRFMMELNLELV